MPYKKGGGGKPELYDEENGEYTEEEKRRKNYKDFDKAFFRFFLDCKNLEISFPNPKWNDQEYCDLFVKYFKQEKINSVIEMPKMKYLLSFHQNNDKSKFLKDKLGYDELKLYNDIANKTDFSTMTYSDLTEYGIKVIACTKLKSQFNDKEYLVTSVWQITKDRIVRFITLYPGGELLWSFIYTRK